MEKNIYVYSKDNLMDETYFFMFIPKATEWTINIYSDVKFVKLYGAKQMSGFIRTIGKLAL